MQIGNKYENLEKVGSGNFSTVYTTKNSNTGFKRAIKIMKTHQNIALKQAYLLKSFEHPNIIKLFDFEQDPVSGQTRMVLEYLPQNTLELYQSEQYGLREQQVKCVLFQSALGLAYIHQRGIIHRDIKPQNILIDKRTAEIKLIDFGLAIPTHKINTDYVATRWYRAPENLLNTKEYTPAIDIFSLACVAVELFLGAPLFPGADNLDQLHKIFNVLGEPNEASWPAGARRFRQLGIQFGQRRLNAAPLGLKNVLKASSSYFADLIEKMLSLNPSQRITSKQVLMHGYFSDVKSIIPPHIFKRFEKDHLKRARSKEAILNAENFINSSKKLQTEMQKDQDQVSVSNKREEVNNITISTRKNTRTENDRKNQQSSVHEQINQKQNNLNNNILTFRGFNPIKTHKISIKETKRVNQSYSKGKQSQRESRNNSIDHNITPIKTTNNSTDISRKIIRNNLAEPSFIIQRRITTDGRDYRTPDLKNRSNEGKAIYYLRSPDVQNANKSIFLGIKTIKSPVVEQRSVIGPTFIKNRIMSGNQSVRLTRNLSEINPPSYRQVVPQFKQSQINHQKQKFSFSPSPVGLPQQINYEFIKRNQQKNEQMKETIYTAPMPKHFHKMKVVASPLQSFLREQKKDKEASDFNTSIYEYNRSKLCNTTELERVGWRQQNSVQQNVQKINFTIGHNPRDPRINLHEKKMISPESKIKLVKSLQSRETGDTNKFNLNASRNQFEQRPSILVMEKKQYRQPRIATKKYVQNEKVVENLSNFLNGRQQTNRNININLNLNIVDNDKISNTSEIRERRGRI